MITFPDTVNSRTDFDTLSRLLEATGLDKADKQCLSDLREYVIKDEDSWVLDTKLASFISPSVQLEYGSVSDKEILFRCVKSLLKFSVILRADLMSCITMVSVDLDTIIPGKLERVDKCWDQLRGQLLASA